MFKIRHVAVAAVVTVSLTACGTTFPGSAANSSDPTTVTDATTTAAPATPATKALNTQLSIPANALGPIPDEVYNSPAPAPDPTINGLPAAGNKSSSNGLTIQVVGECGQNGSTGLRLKATGFTPGGIYMTEVYYSTDTGFDGSRYTHLADNGFAKASTDGSAGHWTWNCYDAGGVPFDPPGAYKLTMHDLNAGRSVTAMFYVRYSTS